MCTSSCKPDRLQLEPDHVLADMLRPMHLIVARQQAPFEPEAGAYGLRGQARMGMGTAMITRTTTPRHEHGHGH